MYYLGPLGVMVAVPLLAYIWKKNLTSLKNIVENKG